MENPFRGLGVALITPFFKDGSIDYDTLENLTELQINSGVDFLCVLGTTAETPTLSEEEKDKITQTVIRVNRGRLPLMLGIGTNNTAQVIKKLQSTNLEDFQGVLVVTPYYNKPSQEGLYQHFKAICEASPIPVILYNVPGRTGVNLTAETTIRISQNCPNAVAIKEASGNISQIEEIIKNAREGFEVLSGDDSLSLHLMDLGAVGVVSVIGNAIPERFGKMIHERDKRLETELSELIRLTMADGNPSGIKAIMSAMGMCENILRLPLVPVCSEVQELINNEIR